MNNSQIHQAMLLAAGKGTRLKPLTDRVPKCMVPVWGKPVLVWNIEHLVRHGIDDIVINLHYLPEVVESQIGDGSRWGIRIRYSFEDQLLGTAGAVKKVNDWWDGSFFVWYGDNLSTCDLTRMAAYHASCGGICTIAFNERENITGCGLIELDECNRISHFFEKPAEGTTSSRYVNAGIYVLEPEVLNYIPIGFSDFGKDIFPRLLVEGKDLYGYPFMPTEKVWWIDTLSDLERVLLEKEGLK